MERCVRGIVPNTSGDYCTLYAVASPRLRSSALPASLFAPSVRLSKLTFLDRLCFCSACAVAWRASVPSPSQLIDSHIHSIQPPFLLSSPSPSPIRTNTTYPRLALLYPACRPRSQLFSFHYLSTFHTSSTSTLHNGRRTVYRHQGNLAQQEVHRG